MEIFVIGAGSIGRRHASNFRELGFKVNHLSWRDTDLSDLKSSLKEKKNVLLVIATATNIRTPLINLCVELDIPMYIEKPIAYKYDDLELIYSMPNELQERSFVGLMMRYHPVVKYLLELDFGPRIKGDISIGHDVNQWRDDWLFSKSYAADKDGGGVLLDLCHEIDLVMLLKKDLNIQNVFSYGHRQYPGIDIDTTISLSSEELDHFSIQLDYISPSPKRRGTIKTDNFKISYDLIKESIEIKGREKSEFKNFSIDRNELFIQAINDFLLVADGKEPKNKFAPSVDRVRKNSFKISEAWENRKFIGEKDFELL